MTTKLLLALGLVTLAFATPHEATTRKVTVNKTSLVGAWRSKVQFLDGPFAAAKDLEFLMTVNTGGTMNESSNYDCAPPVPPAYGIWRQTGPTTYELKYEYFNSKPPTKFDDISAGGGWTPGGRGVIKETVTVSQDSKSYVSKIDFVLKNEKGEVVPGGGKATCKGVRITF